MLTRESSLDDVADEFARMARGNRFLDVGTGFGIMLDKLMLIPGVSVVSIDPEAWTFEQISSKYRDEVSSGRLSLLRMAGERLEFGDSAFDTVFSIGALHHMSDPVSGLREMVRVARQRVLVADWDRESAMWMNPHTEEELSASKELVVPGAREMGFRIEEYGTFYTLYLDVRP